MSPKTLQREMAKFFAAQALSKFIYYCYPSGGIHGKPISKLNLLSVQNKDPGNYVWLESFLILL